VARRWDTIVEAADKNGIFFPDGLQHHGQYSTRTNPNWGENPWNAANGGFLAKPEDFFTDARAKALTKAKYRYIIARWGYSPSILAWELFNEVQYTDAARDNKRLSRHGTGRWPPFCARRTRTITSLRPVPTTMPCPVCTTRRTMFSRTPIHLTAWPPRKASIRRRGKSRSSSARSARPAI
jgi:hypothetical protein